MVETPDWSGLRNQWRAGSSQLFPSVAVKGRIAVGQQLEGGMRPRSFFFFFSFLNSTDFSAFTKIQLTLRERRQEGRDPKPRWRAWPWEEGHLCVAESEDLRKDRF